MGREDVRLLNYAPRYITRRGAIFGRLRIAQISHWC